MVKVKDLKKYKDLKIKDTTYSNLMPIDFVVFEKKKIYFCEMITIFSAFSKNLECALSVRPFVIL